MKISLQQALRAAAFGVALCAGMPAQAAPAAPTPQAAAVSPVLSAGEYRWTIDDGRGEPPYTLRLYVQPLPTGDYALTGSLLLDDAELGASGSARVRDGKLVLDLTASGPFIPKAVRRRAWIRRVSRRCARCWIPRR